MQAAVGSVLEPLEKFRKEQIGEAKVTVISAHISSIEFNRVRMIPVLGINARPILAVSGSSRYCDKYDP